MFTHHTRVMPGFAASSRQVPQSAADAPGGRALRSTMLNGPSALLIARVSQTPILTSEF